MLEQVLAVEPYPLLAYYLLRERDIETWVRYVVLAGNLRYSVLHNDLERTRKRINARCQDLLQVTVSAEDFEDNRVEFLHRTVRDFLQGQEMSQILSKNISEGFQPHALLCRSFSALIRSLPPVKLGSKRSELISFFLHHARKLEEISGTTPETLLDEISHAMGDSLIGRVSFLEHTIVQGLFLYGARKIIQ